MKTREATRQKRKAFRAEQKLIKRTIRELTPKTQSPLVVYAKGGKLLTFGMRSPRSFIASDFSQLELRVLAQMNDGRIWPRT